jgi:putative FmdB family regulatory protein
LPIYEYRCKNGHIFEVMQRLSDAPVTACAECGEPLERVFHPVAVHFKGSGFYTTDYGRNRGGGGDSAGAASGDSKKESKDAAASKSESGKSDSGKSDSGKSDSGKSGDS